MPLRNIVVCVKQVPDATVERALRPGDGMLDRLLQDGLINQLGENTTENGLQIAAAHGGEVTIVSMDPDKVSESIRKALSMDADKAMHLVDDQLAGPDAPVTSLALAKVLSSIGFDLVICGSESVIPQLLAEITARAAQ